MISAADPCYEYKARTQRSPLYRMSARYRHFSACELAVFGAQSRTEILLISPLQMPLFQTYYGTPDERFHLLPPGLLSIGAHRRIPGNAGEISQRVRVRRERSAAPATRFRDSRPKGLDRSLKALAALPSGLLNRCRLIAIGDDDARPFRSLARALGIAERVSILHGRSDILRFLLAADLLIHPAYHENTGTVLLEAVVAGLPVLTTAVCGYANFIVEADAGVVVPEPFEQTRLDRSLALMLDDQQERLRWHRNGLAYAEHADIYSNADRAADVILEDRQ